MLMALFLIGIGVAMAQTQVQGTIVDEQGEPVIGASVLVKGTTTGTVTNIDGEFALSAPSNGTLVISYVGMQTMEVAVSPRIRVILRSDAELLDEVVVTGYGTFKKSSFTGSAATVSTDMLKDVPVTSVSDKLAGNVAGVQINSMSGQPGATESIRIRGMGSINAGNNPLYVIDGVPVLSGDMSGFNYADAGTSILSTLNSSDIENITVIKDAAAASLYGSRAANGVIVITTKKGKAGKTVFNLKANWGFSNMAVDYRPTLDGDARREILHFGLQNYAKYNEGKSDAEAKAYADANIDTYAPKPWSGWTDWRKQLLRTGKYQNYDVSAQGGNEKTKFYSSISYSKQEGIFENSGMDRITGSVNVSHQASDKLTIDVNSLFGFTDQSSVSEGYSFSSPIMAFSSMVSPSSYPYNKDGTLASYFPAIGDSWANPLRAIKYTWNKNKLTRTFNTISGTYTIIKGLKLKEVLSYDFNQNASSAWWSPKSLDGHTANGVFQKYMINTSKLNTQTQLTYDRSFDRVHNLSVLLGYETEAYKNENTYSAGSNYANLEDPKPEIENAATNNSSSHISEYRMLSYLGRVDYNYDSKYYVSASYRRDGSSRLAKANRWGDFWSLSGSWRLTNEPFMESIREKVTDTKIRASYGVNGTQPWRYYDFLPVYSFGYNYDGQVGTSESTPGNANLKWEKNYAFNAGIDLTFFNRFTLTVEWYTRKTQDLLIERPISGTVGFVNRYNEANELVNIGAMRNSGIELELRSTNVQKKDFTWSTTLTLAHNKNKVLTLDGKQNQIPDGRVVHRIGEPYNAFYAYEYAGVDPKTGKELYYKNTNDAHARETTTDESQARKTIIGYADPKVTGGLTNTLTWKFIDLNFTFTYSFGGKVYDGVNWLHSNGGGRYLMYGAIPSYYKKEDTWQNPGDNAKLPLFSTANRAVHSSRWLLSSDHVRLKNLTLGFTLPTKLAKKAGFDRIRAYMSGNNLLTFKSKDLYVDPENTPSGVVYFRAPAMRTVTFGVELGF